MTFLPKNLSQPRTYSYVKRKSNFFIAKTVGLFHGRLLVELEIIANS